MEYRWAILHLDGRIQIQSNISVILRGPVVGMLFFTFLADENYETLSYKNINSCIDIFGTHHPHPYNTSPFHIQLYFCVLLICFHMCMWVCWMCEFKLCNGTTGPTFVNDLHVGIKGMEVYWV